MSLSELKLLAQLETRQKNVNKKVRNIVQEPTLRVSDEPYLFENQQEAIPTNELQIPTLDEIVNDMTEDQVNEIYEYVMGNVIDQPETIDKIQLEYEKTGKPRDAYDKVIKQEVDNLIYKHAKIKLAELMSINLGNQRVERLPNENDEQYLDRLESIRLSLPSSDEIVDLRKQQEKNKLREKLSKIMKYSDTEAIINDRDLMDDDNIALLNRIFPKFNKDIRETFKTIDLQTFKDYTRKYLRTFINKKLEQMPESEEEEYEGTPKIRSKLVKKDKSVFEGPDDNEMFDPLANTDRFNLNYSHPTPRPDGSQLLGTQELRALEEAEAFAVPDIANAMALTNPSQQPSEKGRRSDIDHYLTEKYNVDQLRTKLREFQQPENQYKEYFSGVQIQKAGARPNTNKYRTKAELVKSVSSRLYNIEQERNKTPEDLGWGLKAKAKRALNKTFFGKGIPQPQEEQEKKFYHFGKFLVDNDKLNQNIVRIVYAKTGINHPQMKNTLVSDDFKDLLTDVINNSKFNERAYKKLTKDEQSYMKSLLEKSGVSKILKINDLDDEDDKKLMNRMKIIQGELEIGNNSPLLKKEASEIIKHFISNGKINETNGYKMLYNLAN